MTAYAVRLENGADTAPRTRLADALALQGDGPLSTRSGLRPDGGGEVTVTPGSMTVLVDPFSAWVEGGASNAQGGYPFINDSQVGLTIADGDASLERTDTVAAVVHDDAFDGSGQTLAELVVVQGTPGAGAPALPTSAVPLRDVVVPAGTSSGTGGLSSANIGADRRQYLSAGVVAVSGAAERDNLAALAGQTVFRQDTGKLELFDGTEWVTYKRDDGMRTESGVVSYNFTNESAHTESITFDTPFTGTPAVVCVCDTFAFYPTVASRDEAGATLRMVQRDGNNASQSGIFMWIAHGPA